jgi:hypothetical protein
MDAATKQGGHVFGANGQWIGKDISANHGVSRNAAFTAQKPEGKGTILHV